MPGWSARIEGSSRQRVARRHTNGRDGRDDFTELQLVEDSGLSCSVQTNHQNSHLLLPPEPVEQLGERQTHDCGFAIRRDGYLLMEI